MHEVRDILTQVKLDLNISSFLSFSRNLSKYLPKLHSFRKNIGTHLQKNSHFRVAVHRQFVISTRGAFKLSRKVSRELRYIKKCQAILQSEGTRLLSHPRVGFNHC